jgi:hypothetical protein
MPLDLWRRPFQRSTTDRWSVLPASAEFLDSSDRFALDHS